MAKLTLMGSVKRRVFNVTSVCVCVYSLSVCFDEKRTAITDEAQAPPAVLFHCAVKVWWPSIRHTKATSLGATKQDFQDFLSPSMTQQKI